MAGPRGLPRAKPRPANRDPKKGEAWKEEGAPCLTGQRPSQRGWGQTAGRPSAERMALDQDDAWMARSPFALKRPTELGEPSTRRIWDHPPGTWRVLECRVRQWARIRRMSEVEISRRLDLAVEDFETVRSFEGCAVLPRLGPAKKRGGA